MSESPPFPANVVLVGYRGTGKTTIARRLGSLLQRDWVDADERVESLAGRSIREIFAADGEAAFRDLEEQVTRELMSHDDLVIATGGGVILREANRALLSQGVVIWLTASASTLYSRIYDDPTTSERRPNLTDSGGLAEIQQVLEQRIPLYRAIADFEIDTTAETPDQLASRIVSLLKSARDGA